ncbi:MAG: N-acetyltransferase [Gemmobacter sp.]|jgi:putative acetyltransferase|nr:N-acetyltransferase [Gemmobacter sp.]
MIVRRETPDEARAIGQFVTTAFLTARHADGNEAAIVARLRAEGGLLLSLVAEGAKGLIGHVAASPVTIGGAGGWGCIAPLAVCEAARRQGIGAALMRAALARLEAAGAGGVVVLGDPAYYGRFGLIADPARFAPGLPPEYLLGRSFRDPPPAGEVRFHPAFGV